MRQQEEITRQIPRRRSQLPHPRTPRQSDGRTLFTREETIDTGLALLQ
ncbi:MAG: hypothetical protein KH082_03325 [Bifidobacterium longum]|nr:hypothetical protein [Bifidobacterium longum]